MNFAGFQPLSLLDYPGIICSIVFTQGCPFRCPYCHNPELIPHVSTNQTIPEESIISHLIAHRKLIEGVCITGGEPTIHPQLPEFIRRLKKLGFLVKLDTNGVNPQFVQKLIDEHLLDYIAMDLKHVWEKYDDIVRVGGNKTVAQCKKTFEIIQNSGVKHEFRTTICPGIHQAEDFLTMASYLHEKDPYFIQQFRSGKTLEHFPKSSSELDAEQLIQHIHSSFPSLQVEAR